MMAGQFLVLALAGFAAAAVLGARFPKLWLALSLAGSLALLLASLPILAAGGLWEWRGSLALGGEAAHLRLDALSALFLVLVAVVGGAGAVYSRGYWSDRENRRSAPRGRAWWSLLVLSMTLVLVVSNGVHFLIAWEAFAISAYFLITLDPRQRAVREAGWVYLAASHAGTLCLFGFFAALAARLGTWDLGPVRDHPGLAPLFWLALAGFGVKAGFFPLHVWLPAAHAGSPSHVSAIMSGVAIKIGVYGLVRFSGWLPVPAGAGWAVIGLGAGTALFGIVFAFAQDDLKRLLAYCSVENIGIILTGLGCALLAATHGDPLWGRLALAGALLHVWNHGLIKSLLFFGAGSVLHATGTREMSRLGGLWRKMPWTAGLFALGAAAISGLPPLNGFVSEWLVYMGLIGAVVGRGSPGWAAMPAAILVALAGALALAAFVKASAVIFLGAARTKAAGSAHESGRLMLAPMAAMAGGCLAIGLAPAAFWPLIASAAGAWRSPWADPRIPASLVTLGACGVVFAVLAAAAAALLWRRAGSLGLRRGLTWDCGYAAPTARMQYTSGSFGGIAAGWSSWALQGDGRLTRPRGPFPSGSLQIVRVPEIILDRAIAPVGGLVMGLSALVRRLQHGRLRFYILYLVAGLVALGVMVAAGGAR
jgi:hydrogenase-4 component B